LNERERKWGKVVKVTTFKAGKQINFQSFSVNFQSPGNASLSFWYMWVEQKLRRSEVEKSEWCEAE
jgi:hypothetical protein